MSAQNDSPTSEETDIQWPLSYRLQIPPNSFTKQWWSHELYRGPDDKRVKVLYSKDKERSETLAKLFLDEPVVGFDMEWPWDNEKLHRLQDKIGLIQVASEDTIALFHIGLHLGNTSEDIIAPSLRKLIESPVIAKTGVGILFADFARLKKYFDLKPQAAFELSHLHRLIKFSRKPGLLTTKPVKLAYQVEEHLGLPLSKGSVRTSNWSRPLSQAQIKYAADDAYAGFMLFHCMNAKRGAITPTPPLPILADKYPTKASSMAPISALRLHPLEHGTEVIVASIFFKPIDNNVDKEDEGDEEGEEDGIRITTSSLETEVETTNIARKGKERVSKAEEPSQPLDPISQTLFNQLSERRRLLAQKQGIPAYRIASNVVLQGLARRRPLSNEELLEVKGIGMQLRETYGTEWLEVIGEFLVANDVRVSDETPPDLAVVVVERQPVSQPSIPVRRPRRGTIETADLPDSPPAFGSPLQRTPQMHTGLSFNLAETNLESDSDEYNFRFPPVVRQDTIPSKRNSADTRYLVKMRRPESGDNDLSEDSSAAFLNPPSRSDLHLKRKRSEDTLQGQREGSVMDRPEPLTPRSRIFRNKLTAFSKLVASKMKARPPGAEPIVSDRTLDAIVAAPPRSAEELQRIPGIQGFIQACEQADMALLRNITKFAPVRF